MVAEIAPIQIDEPVPVAILLGTHFGKDLGGSRVVGLESIREILVDACIFLFEGDGQGKHFLLAETLE